MKEFKDYGKLEWLEPEKYYAEHGWKSLTMAEDSNGELFDIVIKGDYPCELRYTII